MKKGMKDGERQAISRAIDALEAFTLERPNIPAGHIVAFLRLALDEGKSVKHYAEVNERETSTMARALLTLGSLNRKGEPGMMLIEDRISAHSRREYEVYLTAKGKTMLRRFVGKLVGAR